MSFDDDLRSLIASHKQDAHDEALAALLPEDDDGSTPTDLEGFFVPEVPAAASGIVEQLALIKLQREALDKEEKRYVEALKAMSRGHKGISDGTRRLVTVSESTTTRVNSAWVKENFDPATTPGAYNVTTSSTLRVDPAFKAEVLAKQLPTLEK